MNPDPTVSGSGSTSLIVRGQLNTSSWYRREEMPEPSYLYGSHYSTPGFVLYYLVRKVRSRATEYLYQKLSMLFLFARTIFACTFYFDILVFSYFTY